MPNLNFNKGIIVGKNIRSDKTITTFMIARHAGRVNLLKFPYRLLWMTRLIAPVGLWKDVDDFRMWLKDQFGHYDDGIYFLLVYRDSISRIKKGGRKRYVRKLEPFAKFEVRGGSVEMPDSFRRSDKTNKIYRVYLLLEKKSEQSKLIKRGKLKF